MSESRNQPNLSTDEILDRIHRLQKEIFEREERIAGLVDAAKHATPLSDLMEEGEERRKIRQLERLIDDWNTMVARSRAATQDDLDLIAALVRFVGDLLVVQHEGIDEKWIERLEQHIEKRQAEVS